MASICLRASVSPRVAPVSTPQNTAPRQTTIQTSPPPQLASLSAESQPRQTPVARAAGATYLFEESEIPTPDVPSTRMMADFLVTYSRTLKYFSASGEAAAAAGSNVLERVRVGVMNLLGQSRGADWERREQELELCLVELQKDLTLLEKYQDRRPNSAVVQMASLRCIEAARLLQKM